MLVSVVIPVYNVASYLPACLDCVCRQTWKNLQIILVDDGSTDNSGTISDEYASKDNRIQVIHQSNSGLSMARNVGQNLAQGEYLLFLDADDEWGSDDFVEQLVLQAQRSHPDVILFEMVSFSREDEQTKPQGIYTPDKLQGTPAEMMLRLMQTQHFSMSACQKFIRTSLLKDNNISFTPNLYGEDMDWIMQLWPYVKTIEGNTDVYYRYRKRVDSITHTYGRKKAEDFCWILEKWENYFEQSKNSNKTFYLAYLAFLYVTLVYGFFYLNKEDRNLLKSRILLLSRLLNFSQTNKSKRLRIVKALFGKNMMLYLFASIKYLRKK